MSDRRRRHSPVPHPGKCRNRALLRARPPRRPQRFLCEVGWASKDCPVPGSVTMPFMHRLFPLTLVLVLPLLADDWPEWRGKGRTGVWNETGILDEFPKEGLTFKWR